MNTEQHAGDAALRQRAAHLPKSPAESTHEGHPDRPRELHILDVLADDLAVGDIEASDPLANRRTSRRQFIKKSRKAFHAVVVPSSNRTRFGTCPASKKTNAIRRFVRA